MPFRVRFTDISILFPQFCSSARSNTERIREGVKKKKKKMVRSLLFLSVLIAASMMEKCGGVNVSYDGRSLVIDGQHKILFSGSIHYPRSTPQVCFYFKIPPSLSSFWIIYWYWVQSFIVFTRIWSNCRSEKLKQVRIC